MIGDALGSFGVMAERFLRGQKCNFLFPAGDFQRHFTPEESVSGESGSIHLIGKSGNPTPWIFPDSVSLIIVSNSHRNERSAERTHFARPRGLWTACMEK